MESNDSPEIPDRGETSDIPGLPSGVILRLAVVLNNGENRHIKTAMPLAGTSTEQQRKQTTQYCAVSCIGQQRKQTNQYCAVSCIGQQRKQTNQYCTALCRRLYWTTTETDKSVLCCLLYWTTTEKDNSELYCLLYWTTTERTYQYCAVSCIGQQRNGQISTVLSHVLDNNGTDKSVLCCLMH